MLTKRQVLPALAAPSLGQRRAPNIVLIVSGDHHWRCLGAAGNPHIQTPQLDKLSARGVLFMQGIVSISQCAPSRGILLSGLESYQNGPDCNAHRAFRSFDGPTVAEQLRRPGTKRTWWASGPSSPHRFLFGLGIASMPASDGNHYYFEIILPGSIAGALVGFAAQRYPRPA
ncbi:MAG: hypothetical protein FJW40_12695 [Acidobacteria bacterium]|nr:hypothetical protein [Acidobacteriota bacterium]